MGRVSSTQQNLLQKITDRQARIAVMGLGYVGLPLAVASARAGFPVTGFDVDSAKAEQLNSGTSYIDAVKSEELAQHVKQGRFTATADMSKLADCQVIIVCVPTPLTKHREPDLSYVRITAETIARHMKPGTLVVLESTSFPGTTREVMLPILASGSLQAGQDFFVGFSPEREDPGNRHFNTTTIPKVIAGDGPGALELMQAYYGAVVERVVPVSTPDTAEAVKITENVFRAVNIALVNELKLIYDAMGIDVWEVIEAAKTKPFGFQAFYPGPGLGGHCIPIDPFYLTWKAREFDIHTRFIELAGQINTSMPRHVISRLETALGQHFGRALAGARILVLGLAYKKNVADVRESPSFKLMELLEGRGAHCEYHDPLVNSVPPTREHAEFTGRKSTALDARSIGRFDAVLLSTDHDDVDYNLIAKSARLIIDTRNRFKDLHGNGAVIVKA